MVDQNTRKGPGAAYIIRVALLISIAALATDLMLPGLDLIGSELGAPDPNDVHLIVTAFFLGMATGQLVVGPLSDSFGRKPVIYAGYVVFLAGCILSLVTDSWTVMLVGRVLQGLGAAAPRIVTVAMVRDEYKGRGMARIMSIVMAALIVVPIIAPALGQQLIRFGGWEATFVGLAVLGVAASFWFAAAQVETLPPEKRRPFRITGIWQGLIEIVKTRQALGYTLGAGIIFGSFIAYLGSAQQIFEGVFEVGDLFPAYFALAAAALGASSLTNAALVMRFGMRRLAWSALIGVSVISLLFWAVLGFYHGIPPLPLFLVWQLLAFFCIGILFGNMNALALEPLGHMAGLGAAFTGSISMFISLPLASVIGGRFDGTVMPLVAGFALLGLAGSAVVYWTNLGLADDGLSETS